MQNRFLFEQRYLAGLIPTVNLSDPRGFSDRLLFESIAQQPALAVQNFQSALQWVFENQIDAVIVGGLAVWHYAKPRKAKDTDFLTANVGYIKQLLKSQNKYFQPLAEIDGVSGIQVPEIDADFLDANSGNVKLNHYILRTAKEATIGGVNSKVISPELLAIYKYINFRQKDMQDAFTVLQSGKVSPVVFRKTVRDLIKLGALSEEQADDLMNAAAIIS